MLLGTLFTPNTILPRILHLFKTIFFLIIINNNNYLEQNRIIHFFSQIYFIVLLILICYVYNIKKQQH